MAISIHNPNSSLNHKLVIGQDLKLVVHLIYCLIFIQPQLWYLFIYKRKLLIIYKNGI
jgi:hypothetical protein